MARLRPSHDALRLDPRTADIGRMTLEPQRKPRDPELED